MSTKHKPLADSVANPQSASYDELEAEYQTARLAYHEAAVRANPKHHEYAQFEPIQGYVPETAADLEIRDARISELFQAMSKAICKGAKGKNLSGIKQVVGVQGMGIVTYWEIGDGENKAKALTREEAVANWNAGIFA